MKKILLLGLVPLLLVGCSNQDKPKYEKESQAKYTITATYQGVHYGVDENFRYWILYEKYDRTVYPVVLLEHKEWLIYPDMVIYKTTVQSYTTHTLYECNYGKNYILQIELEK